LQTFLDQGATFAREKQSHKAITALLNFMLRFIRRYSWPYPGRIPMVPSDLLHILSCTSFIFSPTSCKNVYFSKKCRRNCRRSVTEKAIMRKKEKKLASSQADG
jgi:hypothetical protein